jgi:hypothetical protein
LVNKGVFYQRVKGLAARIEQPILLLLFRQAIGSLGFDKPLLHLLVHPDGQAEPAE